MSVDPEQICASKEQPDWQECVPLSICETDDTCTLCSEELEDVQELLAHLTKQHQVILDACIQCHKIFPTHKDFLHNHACEKHASTDESNALEVFNAVYIPQHKRKKKVDIKPASQEQITEMSQWNECYNIETPSDNAQRVLMEFISQANVAQDGIPIPMKSIITTAQAIICQVCSLLFASTYHINKHFSRSQRHKQAIERQRKKQMQKIRQTVDESEQSLSTAGCYRDRSAERRSETPGNQTCYDLSDDMLPFAGKDAPIASHNKGHKLLLSMGWQKGSGLGRNNDGIISPIIPESLPKKRRTKGV